MWTLLTGSGSQGFLKATGIRVKTARQPHLAPHPTPLHSRTPSNIAYVLKEGEANSNLD